MPRRREVAKRVILPDPKYSDRVVAKLINILMLMGKRVPRRELCMERLSWLLKRTSEDPIKVFKKSLDNIRPVLEVKSRRVGGSTYQVPVEIRAERRTFSCDALVGKVCRCQGRKDLDG